MAVGCSVGWDEVPPLSDSLCVALRDVPKADEMPPHQAGTRGALLLQLSAANTYGDGCSSCKHHFSQPFFS